MSRPFSQGKLQGEQRRIIVQEVQRAAKTAVLQALQPLLRGFLEEEVTAKLGREKGEVRRVSGQAREIDWQCTNVSATMPTTLRVMGSIVAR